MLTLTFNVATTYKTKFTCQISENKVVLIDHPKFCYGSHLTTLTPTSRVSDSSAKKLRGNKGDNR